MDRERLDGWCEKLILGLVLAILVFAPLATGAVRTVEFLVVQGLVGGILLLWVARVWLQRKPHLHWPPVCWAVVAFVAYALIRYLTADIEYVARQEFIRILIYGFVFLAVLNNVTRRESVTSAAFVLIFLAVAISVYAVYQWATESDRVWHFTRPAAYARRGSGTYICPNHLAGFLELILPLALAYVLGGRLGHGAKVMLGYGALVILAGIGVTVSRGAWLATVMALAVFFVLKIKHRNYRLPALVSLVVLLGAGFAFVMKSDFAVKQRAQTVLELDKMDSAAVRRLIWGAAGRIWREHPWFGAGPAHFDYRFRQYRPEAIQLRPDRVHNDYLNTLADWGVIGAVIVAAAWALLFAGVFQCWKHVQPAPQDLAASRSSRPVHQSNRGALVLGAALGLFALLVHSLVDFNWHIPANALVAVTLMALLSGHLRFATERHIVHLGRAAAVLLTLICLAGVAYLARQGSRRITEHARLQEAGRAGTLSDERLAALKAAFAADPGNWQTANAVGEVLRLRSWQGEPGYETLAGAAMEWFERGMKLNRYDPHNHLRYGMCLDWLGRHDEATPYFDRAVQLDPNGYFVAAHFGWHLVQRGEYRAAKPWFERSARLTPYPARNPIAESYLDIIERRLADPPKTQKVE